MKDLNQRYNQHQKNISYKEVVVIGKFINYDSYTKFNSSLTISKTGLSHHMKKGIPSSL